MDFYWEWGQPTGTSPVSRTVRYLKAVVENNVLPTPACLSSRLHEQRSSAKFLPPQHRNSPTTGRWLWRSCSAVHHHLWIKTLATKGLTKKKKKKTHDDSYKQCIDKRNTFMAHSSCGIYCRHIMMFPCLLPLNAISSLHRNCPSIFLQCLNAGWICIEGWNIYPTWDFNIGCPNLWKE